MIAEIEAPDLDQQLLQARADLASQQASAKLSEATLTRRKSLIASNFVSMQEIDERTADLSNKKAAVNSGQANVERLEALAGYKKITVPFDGVVTARDTDVGALINAGGGAGPAMFVVSDISKLRVYVNVPQSYVPAIKIGAKAVISMPEYPNRTFAATVEASSQSVDVGSGTTRMQLALDNARGELMPGGYANVRMSLQRDAVPLHIPASALIFNQNGLRVATVGADDKVLFKTVTIARDLGRDIELASGISAGRPHHRRAARRHRRRRSGPRRRRQGRQARDGVGEAGREGVGGDAYRAPDAAQRSRSGAAAAAGVRLDRTIQYAACGSRSIAGASADGTLHRVRDDELPTRHSSTPSSAVDDIARRAHRRAVHVQQMRQRRAVLRGHPRQRAGIVRCPQHHHAVLDLAAAAVDHRKTLDRALAAGLGDELRHRAAMAVGLGLHAGVLRQRLLRRLPRQHQRRDAW